MARQFILTAKPGCDLISAVENPDYAYSEILEVDNDGTIIGHIPYLPDTEHMYNPEPDPMYHKPQKIITSEGEVEIPTLVADDRIAVGENPFVQLIYRYVKKNAPVSIEDIIRYMTKEKRYQPDTKTGIKRIMSYVVHMHEKSLSGLLVLAKDGYHTGLELKTDRHTVPIKSGYDPIEYQMMYYVENKGTVSRDEFHRFLSDRLKWVRKTKTIEWYIQNLLLAGNIKQVSENWFEFKKPLKIQEVLKKDFQSEEDTRGI
jgi:hypothetical protein